MSYEVELHSRVIHPKSPFIGTVIRKRTKEGVEVATVHWSHCVTTEHPTNELVLWVTPTKDKG